MSAYESSRFTHMDLTEAGDKITRNQSHCFKAFQSLAAIVVLLQGECGCTKRGYPGNAHVSDLIRVPTIARRMRKENLFGKPRLAVSSVCRS